MQSPLLLLLLVIASAAHAVSAPEKLSFGRFGETHVYRPESVQHVALLFSDESGWSSNDDAMARSLSARGILVAGIDVHHYAAELAKPRDKCSYLAGEFEDYSHEMQKHFSPQRYHVPILIGTGRAAGLVYGVTAQGSSGTFVGMLTIGFAAKWQPLIQLCQSYGLRYDTAKNGEVTFKPTEQLSTPWIALQVGSDKAASVIALRKFVATTGTGRLSLAASDSEVRERLVASVESLARPDEDSKILADELRDLPLEEVRSTGVSSRRLVLFLTGDGGWAEIDKSVSALLSQRGIDVVALNSLQYYWKPRSPDEAAKDVTRILRHYLTTWGKSEVLVIGYSFGADVASFIVNRQPSDLLQKIKSVSLLGLAEKADFEVHVTTWLGVDHHGLAIEPEAAKLTPRVLCVYGEGEKDSLCSQLKGPNVTLAQIGKGHHFSDRYDRLVEEILHVAGAQ